MAAGKPIICGIWGESADIVHESGAGICVDFTNHTEAANLIYSFLSRDDLDELGAKGNRYIRLNGDRDMIFEDFYEHICEIKQKCKNSKRI